MTTALPKPSRSHKNAGVIRSAATIYSCEVEQHAQERTASSSKRDWSTANYASSYVCVITTFNVRCSQRFQQDITKNS
ncbi:hypothetical protein VSDG_01981 [Cytospora chrysosperma]|uniref:Uncharacterized protein n=1 Tax=Cytospora chrysosperma TaxID=252740 RepID=A0A423WEA9_CYTCH|nr:hypothetical protein VSDG_01981 [Valsa sordida]